MPVVVEGDKKAVKIVLPVFGGVFSAITCSPCYCKILRETLRGELEQVHQHSRSYYSPFLRLFIKKDEIAAMAIQHIFHAYTYFSQITVLIPFVWIFLVDFSSLRGRIK